MLLLYLASASLSIWFLVLVLPWQPWRNREAWDGANSDASSDLSDVTVLMPARNESLVIHQTLKALTEEGKGLKIILVDDQSEDDTAQIAHKLSYEHLDILSGAERPSGWSGKLWALEQARKEAVTPLLMLLDADVALSPGTVAGLKKKLLEDHLDFVSLMAHPPLNSFWDKLLMPAFIYFFKLLYPFSLANSDFPWVAAAAGGCVLTKTQVLEEIGGFDCIKDKVIDDCALAKKVKDAGFRSWIGLTHSARSIRPYENFREIWDMVARTAYTQLKHSVLLLLLCTLIMVIAYGVPLLFAFASWDFLRYTAWIALFFMMLSYLPTLHFYGLSYHWALFMPFIALLYLGMTWSSAIRYWQGERLRWRGRVVRVEESAS